MNVPVTVGLAIICYLICQHFSTKSRCDIWSLTVAQLMSSVNSKLTSGCPVSLLRALRRYCLSQTEYFQYWKWWERRTSNYVLSWISHHFSAVHGTCVISVPLLVYFTTAWCWLHIHYKTSRAITWTRCFSWFPASITRKMLSYFHLRYKFISIKYNFINNTNNESH